MAATSINPSTVFLFSQATAKKNKNHINPQSHHPSSINAFPNQNPSFISTSSFRNKFSQWSLSASSHFEFDLSPPPIDHDLLDTMEDLGATISEDGTVETFDNDDEAFEAATVNGVAVVDLTHFGRIRVTGEDRIQFLHNQTTANFESLREGQGCDTVFVTPTARTIDISHAWVMKNAITMVVSPVTCHSIIEMLTKYIFFADKVEIHDITKQTCFFTLIGPKCNQLMEDLNLGDLIGQPYGTHRHYTVNGMPITVGVGNLISEDGFSLLSSPAAAESVWKTLLSLGATPMGANGWERLRISQGRPAPEKELTDEFNVLEAGLWNAVSLNKGCYKGQETIARLVTYDGVKQRLWGLHLSAPALPGSLITVNGKKVGKLTSCTTGGNGFNHFGLGYIKRQGASPGDEVNVGEEVVGTVVDAPFLARQTPLTKA